MVAQSSACAMPGRGGGPVARSCSSPQRSADVDGMHHDVPAGADLIYAGKVDHGFDTASANDLRERLKPLIRKTQPYTKRIAHEGAWVEPDVLAEVEYRAKSGEGKVRHPLVFKVLGKISK
jgi:bifunctional non-homologous end joining protein LigD